MLDTKETAQIQMHLLHKKGTLLEWKETWWEDKNKDTEQKPSLHYSNVSY